MKHQLRVFAIAFTPVFFVASLTGCPRRKIDLCSGPDMHPECPGAMNDVGTSDIGADMPPTDMGPEPDAAPDVTLPCDNACTDDTPTCDVENDVCVECVETTDCETGVCTDDNRCVECIETADCTDGVCGPDSTCVECVANTDCTSPTASLCDTTTNTCSPCATSTDCGHLSDTTICDTGECVECLDDRDTTRAACSGNSCDPTTNTCTQTPVDSLTACDYCLADSECPTDFRCVPMEFQGTPRNNGVGGYCLREVKMMPCPLPYQTFLSRGSLSGAPPENYCGIVEANTTCEAVRDLAASVACLSAADCGDPNLSDALCEMINFELRCSYMCAANAECPGSSPCGLTDSYCGGS